MSKLKEEALAYHAAGTPGKIAVVPTKPHTTQKDLGLAYTPGVAEPCLEIEKNPELAYEYTTKGNLVAVISNGTAVLGLGNIGALAGKPVMEGKGLLFKVYAGVDVFDIEINETDPKKFVEVVKAIAPTFGFNLLCSYNLQSTFETYSFYNPSTTPWIIGLLLALLVGWCLFGGGKRIVKITSILVPVMGFFYVLIALIVLVTHIEAIPSVIVLIFEDAFDFASIGGGIAGSCMVYGIKRGLYSNEAGVGSAPNAAASAQVQHPVQQGLVQMLSVYIDTLLICSATALMCLVSGVDGNADNAGARYVQDAVATTFGTIGPVFITVAMALFAFTTLLGNLYYVRNGIAFLNKKKMPGKTSMSIIHIACALVVFLGAIAPMEMCWALADITMGGMALINLFACFVLGGIVFKVLQDYESKRQSKEYPVFIAKDIGLDDSNLDYWKE